MVSEFYIPEAPEGFEFCHPIHPEDFESLRKLIDGQPRRATWRPIDVKVIRKDRGRVLRRSDSPWLSPSAVIFRKEVLDRLGARLASLGECLPLQCQDANVWVFNPLLVLDALDETESKIRRFPNGRVMMIDKYAFHPEVVRDAGAFKLPGLNSPTFFGVEFVDAWNASGLIGLEFRLAWTG